MKICIRENYIDKNSLNEKKLKLNLETRVEELDFLYSEEELKSNPFNFQILEIDDKYLDCEYQDFSKQNGIFYFDNNKYSTRKIETIKEMLRAKRQNVCFPIINRGKLWYDSLTNVQTQELNVWYNNWLNITNNIFDYTQNIQEPQIPTWIK